MRSFDKDERLLHTDSTTGSKTTFLHLGLIALLFVVSRIFALHVGFHYHYSEAPLLWQLLDLQLLRDNLFRALLHLHGQPPLFNLLVGLSEKIAGSRYGDLLVAIDLLAGFTAVVAVYFVLVLLRVRSGLRLFACLLLLLNPAAILFEFDPLYTELVFAAHALIALAVALYTKKATVGRLALIVVLATALTLLRSSYQWIWLLGLVALVLWRSPRPVPKAALALCSAGLLVSLAWPVKNHVLFHHFSSSTWGPFSVSKHWQADRDREPVSSWIGAGVLPTFEHDPFESPSQQQAWLASRWSQPATGYPELDRITKETGGATNWNSLSMLAFLDDQAIDDRFLLRHAPGTYTLSIARALRQYFAPTSDYVIAQGGESEAQYRQLERIDHMARAVCCFATVFPSNEAAQAPHHNMSDALRRLCWGAIAAHLLCLVCLLTLGNSKLWAEAEGARTVAATTLFTIVYIFSVANLLEVNENMRFRFETEPLVAIVVCVFLQRMLNVHRQNVAARLSTYDEELLRSA